MMDFREWMNAEFLLEGAQYISSREFEKRLQALGWRIDYKGSHRLALAPDKIGKITWSDNNWEKNWHEIAKDLFRQAKGRNLGGYPELSFVFQNPFIIPKNLNATQPTVQPKQLYASQLMQKPEVLSGRYMLVGDEWKPVSMAAVSTDGRGLEVLFGDDESTDTFAMNNKITVR